MNSNIPAIGVRFDIDKLEELDSQRSYGEVAWSILCHKHDLSQCPPGTFFLEGDTAKTLNGTEYVYCLVVQSGDSRLLRTIRTAISQDAQYARVAAAPGIVDGQAQSGEPFVEAAHIDAKGNVVVHHRCSSLRPAYGSVPRELTRDDNSESPAKNTVSAGNWISRLFGRVFGLDTEPARDADALNEAIRQNPQDPSAHYEISALPNASTDSHEHYERAVSLDFQRDPAFFRYHWTAALRCAVSGSRADCANAFSRALIVDAKQYTSEGATIDPGNRFARCEWKWAMDEPQPADLLWPESGPTSECT